MKFDTVIFDLDGTLLNTLEDLKDSVNYALDKLGFKQKNYEEIKKYVGNGVRKLIERSVPENTPENKKEQCVELFKKHYDVNMQNNTKPYNGIPELLSVLKKNNIKVAVVSNKYDTAVKYLCRLYFDGLIDTAIGESAGINKKPSPDSVFKALDELNSEKHRTIYVGDSETDVKTAQNSGLKFVGVTWGFRDKSALQSPGTLSIIDNPLELIKIINSD